MEFSSTQSPNLRFNKTKYFPFRQSEEFTNITHRQTHRQSDFLSSCRSPKNNENKSQKFTSAAISQAFFKFLRTEFRLGLDTFLDNFL